MAPFLSVVTRNMPGRQAMLDRNLASLQAQSDPDYERLVLLDDVGRGFEYARQMLITARNGVAGRYALILDDDDVMEAEDGIAALKAAAAGDPPAIVFRGRHADMGVLPTHSWQGTPKQGDIGSFDFVLRRDVYDAHVEARGSSDYAHDFAIIEEVYAKYAAQVVWLDKVICAADKRRIGGTR